MVSPRLGKPRDKKELTKPRAQGLLLNLKPCDSQSNYGGTTVAGVEEREKGNNLSLLYLNFKTDT